MSRARKLSACLAATAFAMPLTVSAQIEETSAGELYSSCRSLFDAIENPVGLDCMSYVRGLVDASRMVSTYREPEAHPESFRERALRTRAGSRIRPHCVAGSVSLEQLVRALLEPPVPDAERTSAAAAVYRTLQRFGTCRPR
jgi:hypothetical protein